MSSIIVLDSSDEDESPPKKANLKTTSDFGDGNSKNSKDKQRSIPSGITITPLLSPTSIGTKSSNMSLNASSYQAHNSIIHNERQTPTPPKAQIAGSINQRKRKTPTPPKTLPRLTTKSYGNLTNSSPAKAATTLAPLPPIMPMITGVHSMADAGSTPPLQLMATPSHNIGSFMGLNEQLMINPHLIPSSLPPYTTIKAHTNPNQNNINNNFKIHLPFSKPNATTPSPAASPASSAPKTPSPRLTSSPQPSRADRNTKRIMPTTLLKSSDESWQRHKQSSQNDKQSQKVPISLSNDVVIEMLPPSTESPKSISASSSRHHTPMTSPTTPKSQKSPDVIMLTPPTDRDRTPISRKDCETILDLTHSPNKITTPSGTEIVDLVNTPNQKSKQVNGEAKKESADKKPEKPPPPKPPLEPEYEELIKACRAADPSKDMEKLIKSKLIKYYYEVHSDYVKSKSFRKNIRKVLESIKAKPDLVYFNLKTIVEELKVRRRARPIEDVAAAPTESTETTVRNGEKSPAAEGNNTENSIQNTTTKSNIPATSSASEIEIPITPTTSTGNKKLDEQIKKLNKALYVLTKRIEVLEQAEVDWDDDDSSFLQVERYKKRACQIYEKICDLTGESKNAHRLVKRPIKFSETRIPQFNKTLQAFINRTKEFPDYFDVLRMLEHCNRTYSLGLVNFEMKNIAEDAFIKVGKLLQSRRKADLYETVTHFAGDGNDPAKTDASLAAKLNENLKNHKKISDILEKFARKQDMPEEEDEEKSEKTEENSSENTNKINEIIKEETEISEAITNINALEDKKADLKMEVVIKAEEMKNETNPAKKCKIDVDEDDEDDDDEEDDEEDEENLDEQVENLANGDISDNESDVEIVTLKDNKHSPKSSSLGGSSVECINNDNLEIEKGIQPTNTTKINELDAECIEIHDNSQVILMPQKKIIQNNVSNKNMGSPEIIINSDEDCLITNNNLEISSVRTIKTVRNAANTTEYLSPSSPPTPLASIIPTRNGKLKDSSPQLLLNHDDTAAIATTTTADLKIVHVSSLDPKSDPAANNNDGNNITATNKSLEEIVISDEES